MCAPSSTIDMGLARGEEIPIEERPAEEVTQLWYAHRMAPAGVKVDNPAFDVTDHGLVLPRAMVMDAMLSQIRVVSTPAD